MSHSFRPYSAPGNRPNERDVIRTMECSVCGLRHVVCVGSGESLSGPLLQLIPDCETLFVKTVMES